CAPHRRRPRPPLFPYTTLFRSDPAGHGCGSVAMNAVPASHIRSLLVVGAHAFDAEVIGGPLAAAVVRAGGRATLAHLSLGEQGQDRKSTRLNSSHVKISYAVFC